MNITTFVEVCKQIEVKVVNTIDITPFVKHLESYFNNTITVNKFKLGELGDIIATTNDPNITITASVFEEQDDFAFTFSVIDDTAKVRISGLYKNHQWDLSINQ